MSLTPRMILRLNGIRSFDDLESRWLRDGRRCNGCGASEAGPVLHNHLWYMICLTTDELLCVACIRERLGRPITMADIKIDLPWNVSWMDKYGELPWPEIS